MNSSTPRCATCASTSLVKAGHNGSGTQPSLCKACGAHRLLVAKNSATDAERKAMILRAVEIERLGLRAAERVFGVAWATIVEWLKKSCGPADNGDGLELDELWSFVGSKLNSHWVEVALCRQTHQMMAYFVGDRAAQSAHALRMRIPPDDYRRRASRNDFWLAYAKAFQGKPSDASQNLREAPLGPITANEDRSSRLIRFFSGGQRERDSPRQPRSR